MNDDERDALVADLLAERRTVSLNWFDPDRRPDEVGIVRRGSFCEVYATSERAGVHGVTRHLSRRRAVEEFLVRGRALLDLARQAEADGAPPT